MDKGDRNVAGNMSKQMDMAFRYQRTIGMVRELQEEGGSVAEGVST